MRFVEIFRISADRIITEMNKFVTDLFSVIISSRESNIALFVKPYRQWVEIGCYDPLSDIKLTSLNDKWILYVFLSNPLRLFGLHMILNLD